MTARTFEKAEQRLKAGMNGIGRVVCLERSGSDKSLNGKNKQTAEKGPLIMQTICAIRQ
jgi:hypothetical protein